VRILPVAFHSGGGGFRKRMMRFARCRRWRRGRSEYHGKSGSGGSELAGNVIRSARMRARRSLIHCRTNATKAATKTGTATLTELVSASRKAAIKSNLASGSRAADSCRRSQKSDAQTYRSHQFFAEFRA
jgi:hypothetical protein